MKTLAAIMVFSVLGAIAALCPAEASPAALQADITLPPVLVVGCLELNPCNGLASK